MEKKFKYSGVIVILLVVVVVAMSVGFAVYSTMININGTATVQTANWNVALDEATYQETEGSVAASPRPTINATSMNYTVTLNEPGDFYEFTIDVKNTGTFDAELKGITMGGITGHENYLKYTITYDGTDYTTTNASLSGLTLAAETGVKEIKVRVEYIQPASASDLPQTQQTVNLTASFDFQQAA